MEACTVIDTASKQAGLIEAEVMERALDLERETGKTVALLTMFHRHFGRGYNTGSFEFPRIKYFEDADHVSVTHAIVEQMAFWKRQIADRA